MSTEDPTRKITYLCDGATMEFTIPFKYVSAEHVLVERRSVSNLVETLSYPSEYIVVGTLVITTALYDVGDKLTIYRETSKTQPTELEENSRFSASVLESDLDKGTFIDQEVDDTTKRTIRAPVSDLDLNELPTAELRANQLLGFNSAGQPISVYKTVPPTVSVSPAMEPVLEATTLSDARDAMGVEDPPEVSAAMEPVVAAATLSEARDELGSITLKQVVQYSKRVGELYYADTYEPPSEYNEISPDDFNPAICLNTIDGQVTLSATNWPDLVPHLRARKLAYLKGKTGEKTNLDITNWDVTTNVGTLTFANTDAENAILAAMLEDKVVHGSYSNWRTITVGSAIGNIPAADYAISAIDTTLRTVTFAVTASDGSGAVTATAAFYPHRIAGSTTTAREFETSDRAIISEASDGSVISGLRHRDFFQDHWHSFKSLSRVNAGTGGPSGAANEGNPISTFGDFTVQEPIENADTLSGTPRTDTKTKPKALGAFVYKWGRNYVA